MRDFWARREDARTLSPEQLEAIRQAFSVAGEVRPVQRAPGYAVSDDGRVFSGLLCSWQRLKCPRQLKPIPHLFGYQMARLHVNRRATLIGIHVLVAEAFLLPPSEGQNRVRHRDDNPGNNAADNLLWGTQQENMEDMIHRGRSLKGMKSTQAKLTDRRVQLIRGLAEEGFSLTAIAHFFGIHYETARRAVNGESWSHVG
jgi:hypothetical protein